VSTHLEARTLRLGLPPPSPSRKPSRTRIALARRPAAEAAAKRRPAPTQAEAVQGTQGSAGQGAVPNYSIDL